MEGTLATVERKVLDFIVECQGRGFTPTYREIADHFKWSGPAATQHTLDRLKRKGFVTWKPTRARSIVVLDTGRAHTVWGNFPIGSSL